MKITAYYYWNIIVVQLSVIYFTNFILQRIIFIYLLHIILLHFYTGYNMTIYPNIIDHATQGEAGLELSQYSILISVCFNVYFYFTD